MSCSLSVHFLIRVCAGVACNATDVFDSVTGKWSTAELSVARTIGAAVSVGRFAMCDEAEGQPPHHRKRTLIRFQTCISCTPCTAATAWLPGWVQRLHRTACPSPASCQHVGGIVGLLRQRVNREALQMLHAEQNSLTSTDRAAVIRHGGCLYGASLDQPPHVRPSEHSKQDVGLWHKEVPHRDEKSQHKTSPLPETF